MSDLALPTHKVCTKCGLLKPLGEFYRDKTKSYGRRSQCKQCQSACMKTYREANREVIVAKKKEWQQENAEIIAAYKKEWRQANAEVIATKQKKWRQANAEVVAIKKKKWVNQTTTGAIGRWWSHLNSRCVNGSHPAYNNRSNRRCLKKGVRLEITREELRGLVEANWDIIQQIRASGQTPSIDRIVTREANSPPDVGHYSLGNIRFVPWSENSSRVRRKRKRYD